MTEMTTTALVTSLHKELAEMRTSRDDYRRRLGLMHDATIVLRRGLFGSEEERKGILAEAKRIIDQACEL